METIQLNNMYHMMILTMEIIQFNNMYHITHDDY